MGTFGEINCKSCYTYCCHMIKIFDKMKQISFVTRLSLFFCFFLPYITNAIEHSFVNVETDFHKIHRNLLQDDTSISDGLDETPLDENVQKEVEEEEKEEPIVFKGLAEPGEYKLGPRLFFDSKEFLMRLGAPIRVTIFPSPGEEEGHNGKLSTVDLNAEAVSVKGSMIDEHSFKVNIDWKSQNFGNDFKITTIQIHMYFVKTKDEYYMKQLEVIGVTINGQQIHKNELEVQTKYGYKVVAPLGSSFCCYDPGMFEPKKDPSEQQNKNAYAVGLTFPKMQLQVFRLSKVRFGPEWTCDEFMTIGVWVGLLVTLLFASICVWGFCMLGNIETMDRFDDPRGKSIYVPQTD